MGGGSRRRAEVGALLVVLVVSGIATLLATSRYGIGMTPDSVLYRVGADNLAHGLGFSRDGAAITIWPPGYSAVLSIGEHLGIAASAWARAVAVGAFSATTVLGFILLRRHVRSAGVVIAGTVVIGCSTALLSVFEKALSEHLFIVVVLLLLLAADELALRPRSVWLLAISAVLVWAGFLLRYAGIVLLPFMALVVLVAAWPLGRRPAVVRAAAFTAGALVGPALWMMRNANVGSGAFAERREAEATLLVNVERTVLTLGGWLSFQGPSLLRLGALLAVALAACVALAVWGRPIRAALATGARAVWPLVLFVVIYLGYLVGTASVVAFEAITTRYVIPVYVPLAVLGAWAFERVHLRLAGASRVAVTVLALLWVAGSVIWFGAHAAERERNGAGGYASAEWHSSRLMADVEAWGQDTPLVTNDPNGIELFTGRHVIESVPKTFGGSNEATGRLPRFIERVRCEERLALVWFSSAGTRGRLYSPRELARHLRVVPIVERPDGVIYELTPLPATAAAC